VLNCEDQPNIKSKITLSIVTLQELEMLPGVSISSAVRSIDRCPIVPIPESKTGSKDDRT